MESVSKILVLLARCFFVGLFIAVFLEGLFFGCYWLYRAAKGLRQLRRPRAERQAERAQKEAARRHPLSGVSGRARTAWLLLCLENALIHFGQTAEDWGWVLERLWFLTEAPEGSFRPLFQAVQLLPVNILPYGRAEDVYADPLYETLADIWDGEAAVSEEDFLRLRTLYVQAGWRLCVLDPLLQAAFKAAAAAWVPSGASEALVMDLLQQAETLLEGWDIPLPEDSAPEAVGFLRKQAASGWGPAFDGARWSVFLKRTETGISVRKDLEKG